MVILVLIKPLMNIITVFKRVDNSVNNNLPLVQHNNYNKK